MNNIMCIISVKIKVRPIPINNQTVWVLRGPYYKNQQNFRLGFLGPYVKRSFTSVCKLAGLEVSGFYNLKHPFIPRLIKEGWLKGVE